jgi:hypothetical protein
MISACLIEDVFMLAVTPLQMTFDTVYFAAIAMCLPSLTHASDLFCTITKVYANGLGMTVEQVRTVLRKQADTLGKSVEANLQLKARYFTNILVSVTSGCDRNLTTE